MGTVTDLALTPKPAPTFQRFVIFRSDGEKVSYVGCTYAISHTDECDLAILDEDGAVVVHFLPYACMSIEGRPISATEYRRIRKRRVTWDAD